MKIGRECLLLPMHYNIRASSRPGPRSTSDRRLTDSLFFVRNFGFVLYLRWVVSSFLLLFIWFVFLYKGFGFLNNDY